MATPTPVSASASFPSSSPQTSADRDTTKRVDFVQDAIERAPQEDIDPSSQRWISSNSRSRTNLDDVVVDSRPVRHNQIFKRPRALLYQTVHDGKEKDADGSEPPSRTSSRDARDSEERSTDDVPKQLRRIDLFVDLVWVGIIANLSGTYGEQAFTNSGVDSGLAVLEFVLLFFPIWRVWDDLRSYTSHHYVDDVIQRLFVVWILVLAVVYGINAPFAYTPDGEGTSYRLLIIVYLVARASFAAALAFQCVFLPVVRRRLLYEFCAGTIPFGLYVGSLYVPYPGRIALLVLVNAVEQPFQIFQESPAGERLLAPKGVKRVIDTDRYIERYEGFFIIILGEGVFRLIEGSPSGMGINKRSGTVVTTLLLYYVLHWLYFNGDQSKQFVHALRRTWWKPILWRFYHKAMFAALLFLDASTLFLVKNRDSTPVREKREAASGEEEDSEEIAHYVLYALWSASIALAVTLFSMTHLALLNRPLDPPRTLLINSRIIRLAPRLPAMVAVICLPLFENMNGGTWCGIAIIICYVLFLFESIAGMERNWKVVEPREAPIGVEAKIV